MAEVETAELVQELSSSPPPQQSPPPPTLTAAQRARMERQRLRAAELHQARLAHTARSEIASSTSASAALDSGGGFLLEAAPPGPGAGPGAPGAGPAAAPAPLVHASLQPECLECGRRVPHSYLLDTFQYAVCDDCRDEEGAHALVTRTEAKGEFLLKDCDLDLRAPPLPCVRRRNPHRAAAHDMRLYLRAQLRERALLVWGSQAALDAERARRGEARTRAAGTRARRRLRDLRLQVRSGLYQRAEHAHRHEYGPETCLGADAYGRTCATCGHVDAYEKM